MKYYKLLKKLTLLLVVGAIGSIALLWIVTKWWSGDFSWKEMQTEYVGKLEYSGYSQVEKDKLSPITINMEQIKYILEDDEKREINYFFEIRSDEDWEYVCNVLGIQENSINLDFSSYYVISVGRKLKKLEYIDEEWMKESYRDYVRGEIEENSYEEGVIHIYRMKEKITFLYDYSLE